MLPTAFICTIYITSYKSHSLLRAYLVPEAPETLNALIGTTKLRQREMAQGIHLCHNNPAAEAADPAANCWKLEKAPPLKNWYLAEGRSLFLLDAISGHFSLSVWRRVRNNLWTWEMDAGCLSCHAHALRPGLVDCSRPLCAWAGHCVEMRLAR
jgi:hypothetical protein